MKIVNIFYVHNIQIAEIAILEKINSKKWQL